jgi:UDP-GlcNAc:undecaprenyl-phosphate/decaprenyl-phosphate GlcNAc-1-phosphate transferase
MWLHPHLLAPLRPWWWIEQGHLMRGAVLALLCSLLATVVLLRLSAGAKQVGRHGAAVSGLAAVVGVCVGWLSMNPLALGQPSGMLLAALPCVALPVFLAGLVVDFWRPVSLHLRVVVSVLTSVVAVGWWQQSLGASAWGWGAAALALLFISSVTHAMAVVDRRNGAAAMCTLLMLASVAYVAGVVGDGELAAAALVVIGAVLGLSFFSFQANLACLGRSGCSWLGFITAAMALLLVQRNAAVSGLFALLVCAHPLLEAAWAWHRLRKGAKAAEGPSLMYLQLVRWATGNAPDRRQAVRDNGVAPHLWMLSIVGLAPAVLWWQEPVALALALLLRVAVQVAAARLMTGLPSAAFGASKNGSLRA